MLRKTLVLIFSICVLFCLQASAQTVDELVSKNIKARGGLEKIKAVKTMKMTGKALAQGMEAPFTVQIKRPNSVRVETTMQGKTLVQAYDGKTAWWIMPFMGSTEPEKMPEQEAEDAKEQSDIDGPLVDYKEKGHKLELVGKEDMEGTEVYKLKLTLKTGVVRYVYIDSKNFMELKSTAKRKRQGNELEVDTYLSDYKPVNGVMIPHSIEHKVKGQTVAQLTLNKIEMDTNIDDSIFKMPAKSQDKQPSKQDRSFGPSKEEGKKPTKP